MPSTLPSRPTSRRASGSRHREPDRGPRQRAGHAGDVIEDILDFTVRVSSREAYVGPTRGAQGNALKTLLAMPFVLDGTAGWSRSRASASATRSLRIDRIAQEPEAEIGREPSLVKTGTVVRLHWPDSASSILAEAARPIRGHLYRVRRFNPHLQLTARVVRTRSRWEPTNTAWKRWRPCDPVPAHGTTSSGSSA